MCVCSAFRALHSCGVFAGQNADNALFLLMASLCLAEGFHPVQMVFTARGFWLVWLSCCCGGEGEKDVTAVCLYWGSVSSSVSRLKHASAKVHFLHWDTGFLDNTSLQRCCLHSESQRYRRMSCSGPYMPNRCGMAESNCSDSLFFSVCDLLVFYDLSWLTTAF